MAIARALPHEQVSGFEVLSGGLINTNLKVHLKSEKPPVVLRLYRDGAEVCRKEVAILQLVGGSVSVPQVVYAEPEGFEGSDAFAVLEYVNGITFQSLKHTNDADAIRLAATSIGRTLAEIGRYHFSNSGRLVAGAGSESLIPGPDYVEGPDPIPTILDSFLSSPIFQRRVDTSFAHRLHDFVWSWAPQLPDLSNEHSLVHCDFGNRNIMVCEDRGQWAVAAVLDWEFAFSGSPLLDVGHFMRYERRANPLREPWFSRAYVEHGGKLPDDWRQVVRIIDLTGVVECLTHEYLPVAVAAELFDLVEATLEDRDPK
jgi:aminoglycoside phosphotransferase (APT) family kinase protein